MRQVDTPSLNTWEHAVSWLRHQPEKQQLVLDAYYDDPLEGAAMRFWQSGEWATARALMDGRTGGTALDIGAGRGIASYALAKDGWQVTALEPDPSNLVGAGAIRLLAEQANLAIQVEQTISERLPFADGQFDLVYGRAVLHHIGDLSAACAEFARVLKPGGMFIAAREHVISSAGDLPAFLAAHPLHSLYGGENAHQLGFYEAAIRNGGLQLQNSFGPFESEMNYAPHSPDSLVGEIAARAGHVPSGPALVKAMLSMPLLGRIAIQMLQKFDNRPGRHYSFVAVKPQ
jgi:2-polyprenyl-3-methyl-5-hydroxy-6-metoxy-1,4-benzoquinol methylase